MYNKFKDHLLDEIENTKKSGLYKSERIIKSPQSSLIETSEKKEIINLCSNNYLGLSSHPEVTQAAKDAIDTHGFGMSSVRFICGTQDIHKELENKISSFLGMEDTILYAAAFDANGGVFEPLFGPEDAIISDQLNHASIIDGIRLCKAQRHRYLHNDMNDLEEKLKETSHCRARIIVTDGVFSMDGTIAQLDKISELAKKYNALVMSDECHSTGFIGEKGRGVHELKNVMGKVDIITGTLGKALGGASGGFTSSKKEVIEILRQKSRPYLFSNTLAPSIVGASLKVFELIENDNSLIKNLQKVSSFLGSKDKPVAISEDEIKRILGQVTETASKQKSGLNFEIGEKVKVCDGPFASFSGLIEEIDEEKSRLKVSVSIFGRPTPVDLEFNQVEKN